MIAVRHAHVNVGARHETEGNSVANGVHRSYRYGKDYPGLKGKDLSKKVPLTDCPEFWKLYKTAE